MSKDNLGRREWECMYVVVLRSKHQANQSQKDMKKNGMRREKGKGASQRKSQRFYQLQDSL